MSESVEASEAGTCCASPESSAGGQSRTPPGRAWLLFIFLFVVYSLNPEYMCVSDMKPNVWQALRILSSGNLTFTVDSDPSLFDWRSGKENGGGPVEILRWDEASRRQYAEGTLELVGAKYFIVESTTPGRYVNIYGIGPALTALPFFATVKCFVPDLTAHPELAWFTGRETAAALAALSAVFLYLAALALTGRRNALIIALAYGLGTCVWSTCSQGLWQQTPTLFYLALGACLFVRIERVFWLAAPCAIAWAMAVWCRPTSAIVVLCAGVWLALRDRRAFAAYLLAGLPFGVALAFHNYHYLGSPFAFGQDVTSRNVAVTMTGASALWQTPLSQGLAGLLASPARGLFVYSPFLLLAIPGMVRVWTTPKHAVLRPFVVAALLILCVEAKFFCWWGGWSYGYRIVLDITVFMSLMLVPVMDLPRRNILLGGLFTAAVLWSAAVQIFGVTAYDQDGWNNRKATIVARNDLLNPVILLDKSEAEAMRKDPAFVKAADICLNVDNPAFRSRLWSIADSPLVYYATHFSEARKQRAAQSQRLAADMLRGMLDSIKRWAHEPAPLPAQPPAAEVRKEPPSGQ